MDYGPATLGNSRNVWGLNSKKLHCKKEKY